MKKISKLLIIFFLFLFLPSMAFAVPKQETKDNFNLNCKSAILMENSTGKIIYEYNSHAKHNPASVTKIMTMLLAMEAVDDGRIKLNDKVVVSERAKSMGGSEMYLDTGEIRTFEEIIKGVAIESANDAAVAIAEFLSGTVEDFVDLMNNRAKELGMNDTNFKNPTGLDAEGHVTSAYDIAIMSRELLKHKKITEYTNQWMETISEGRKEPFTLVNRNKMLKSYNGCDGLKTGFTSAAKYSISATAVRNNVRFISVIMGAPSAKERNQMAGKLLDYGFARFDSVKVVKEGEEVAEVKIQRGKTNSVKGYAKEDFNLLIEKGDKVQPEKEIELKNVKAPVEKGDTVGYIKLVDKEKKEKVYGKVEIIIKEDVKKVNFFDVLGKTFGSWVSGE